MGAAYLLPRVVGLARATELLLLGDKISAKDALLIGLVNRLVPAEAVVSEAQALNATLTCVVHSNRPKKSEATPARLSVPEEPKVTAVETIRGGKRDVVYFPANGGKPIKDETAEK